MAQISLPTSIGDAVDRLTILQIKRLKFSNPAAVANVEKELFLIEAALEKSGATISADLNSRLYDVNLAIFEDMDLLFATPADSADYLPVVKRTVDLNIERAHLKRAINDGSGSTITEEKSYFVSG